MADNHEPENGPLNSERVITACRKVMFHKHHGEDSESDDDDTNSIKLMRSAGITEDVQDAEELASKRPENVDWTVTSSLFRSSGVQSTWTSLKQKSEAEMQSGRRSSLWILPTKHVKSAPPSTRRVRNRKGLTEIINSFLTTSKLSKRYEDKLKVGDMHLSRRQIKLLSVAFATREERQEKIEALRSNIATIDDKVRQLHSQKSSLMMSYVQHPRATSVSRNSQPTVKDINENMVRFSQQDETMEYFRRWVRVVIIVLRWISVILQISENKRSLDRELKSFTDIANEIERQSQSFKNVSMKGPTFDKSNYVTKKEITLSYDVRRTLTLRSVARTPTMLQQVMHGLQTLQSLAEYPLHIQEKLCKVAWYQQIQARRAILRQGHFAEFFYFILSGQAFVKKMVENERTKEPEMRTVARLTKGQSFGEVALLYRTTRTATVESATPMELLMVSGEDFIRIFTRTGNPDEEPGYVAFLRQISVFGNWPLSKIKTDPGTCFLHYFKRGSVVTLDSVKSDWIFIIKAGCCEVLQKLNAVKPRSSKCLEKLRRLDDVDPVLPRSNVPFVEPKIDDGSSKSGRKVPVPFPVFDAMNEYFHGLRKDAEAKRDAERKRVQEEMARKIAEERKKAQQSDIPDWKNFRKTPQKVSFSGAQDNECEDSGTTLPGIATGKHKQSNKRRAPCRLQTLFPDVGKSYTEAPTESDLLKMYEPVEDPTKADDNNLYSVYKGSVYVTIELLQAKDVFGLNTLNIDGAAFEKVSPVCLVSRGAEIILLSKKLFMKYADDNTRHLVKEHVKRYPGESTMQMNLQSEVDWDLYKDKIIQGFLKMKSHEKTLLPTV